MKLHILSDLHLEFSEFTVSPVDADVIVLAGDIWTGNRAISWARKTWPDKPIVYVAGNHEFYKHEIYETLHDLRTAAAEFDVHFLERDEVVIDGVRFLGCTLWTDFALFGEVNVPPALEYANRKLNDFRLISILGRRFLAEDSLNIHEASVRWLEGKLLEPFEGNTVVVTHHSPSWNSVAYLYQEDVLSACFSSRLDRLMGHSKIWIHGHTHDSFDYEINGTRVVCNPQGYVFGRVENINFDSKKIIEI